MPLNTTLQRFNYHLLLWRKCDCGPLCYWLTSLYREIDKICSFVKPPLSFIFAAARVTPDWILECRDRCKIHNAIFVVNKRCGKNYKKIIRQIQILNKQSSFVTGVLSAAAHWLNGALHILYLIQLYQLASASHHAVYLYAKFQLLFYRTSWDMSDDRYNTIQYK